MLDHDDKEYVEERCHERKREVEFGLHNGSIQAKEKVGKNDNSGMSEVIRLLWLRVLVVVKHRQRLNDEPYGGRSCCFVLLERLKLVEMRIL